MNAIVRCLMLLPLLLVQTACNIVAPYPSGERCDSLYSTLDSLRYVDAESFRMAVDEGHRSGDDLCCSGILANARAYAAVMDMDYQMARHIYDSVISVSKNELERLESNIGMMRLCNRVSANREFYDYRTGALRSMQRIEKEDASLSEALKRRFHALALEYEIVSANYFASLGLYADYSKSAASAAARLGNVDVEATQLAAGLVTASSRDRDISERFTILYRGITRSDAAGYKWLSAHYKLMLATMLRDKAVSDSLYHRAPGRMARLNSDSVSVERLPQWLAESAIEDFGAYGDRYMIIKSLALLASCHTYIGDYEDALYVVETALSEVNRYYSEYYADVDTLPPYELYQSYDSLELKRMALAGVVNIPECLLMIRNEISCIYAALGDKEASDMNRNGYLDLLRVTRQNRELESRLENTSRNSRLLSHWAVVLLLVFVIAVSMSVFVVRRLRRRNSRYTSDLMTLSALCRELAAFPLSHGFADENDVDAQLSLLLRERLGGFLGDVLDVKFSDDGSSDTSGYISSFEFGGSDRLLITTAMKPDGDGLTIAGALLPYIFVARVEACRLLTLGDERTRLEELNVSYALNLAAHKRANVLKRASLSVAGGIRPYMDRMANELNMLARGGGAVTEGERLAYIAELADKIGEYNTILERWIKMRRGDFNLSIENFELQELFDIIAKGAQVLASKGLTLDVRATDAVVKADKALTLFMINTLVDNAVKFTPEGGRVELSATVGDSYAEVSVKDSGVGMSAEDINIILGEKVYDASAIGRDRGEAAAKNKGFGFGLMNCKGIIEKYRKTDALFSVCRMDIESTPGHGSRFSFRLPKGVVRTLLLLLMMLPWPLGAVSHLNHITSLADSVYLSNVNGDYENTLRYAALVLEELNDFYRESGGIGDTLRLRGKGEATEMEWWREGFASDTLIEEVYYNLLDVRNEAAVAMLALQQWDGYRYNNNAYTSLYRLAHEDKALESYYANVRSVANARQVMVVVFATLLVLLSVSLLLYYFRTTVINRMNLNAAVEVNRRLLKAVGGKRLDVAKMVPLLADELYDAMRELLRLSSVRMVFRDEQHDTMLFSDTSGDERMELSLARAYKEAAPYTSSDGRVLSIPLLVSTSDGDSCVGAVAFETEHRITVNERLMVEIVAGYVASVAYHATVGMEREYRNFDELVEESGRIRYEENMLHVQNQVMDNCLSMIKHETVYYPNRIRELVAQLSAGCNDRAVFGDKIIAMRELMEYYSSIYGVLTTCAANQLSDAAFVTSRVQFSDVAIECASYLKRRAKRNGVALTIDCAGCGGEFYGDKELVNFLMESLLDELAAVPMDGSLLLRSENRDGALLVELTDTRRRMDAEALSQMFVPSSQNIDTQSDSIRGAGFLVAKEIVRMHEDFMGVYGGRMEAVDSAGGTVIRFTLPI